MTNRFTVLGLMLLAVVCLSTTRPAAADDQTKDDVAIRKLAAAFEKAHNKHDAKAFAALFAPDGDFTSVRGTTARGRERIEEFHRPMFEGETIKGNPSFKDAVLKIDDVKVRFIR